MTPTEALDLAVMQWVAAGWRLDARAGNQAALSTGAAPNHVLHALLTVVTLGLWGIIWLGVALSGDGIRRVTLIADADGNVHDSLQRSASPG